MVARVMADGSSIDNAITTAANATAAIVNASMTPLLPTANLLTAINTPNITPMTVIAPRALLRPSDGTAWRAHITPVRINIAPDIISNIAPAFAAFLPAKYDKATIAPNKANRVATVLSPLSSSD